MIRPSRQRGFSLIEALVGLSLIGVALLMTISLMAQQPKMERRLAAREEALRTAEVVLELMRASASLPKALELSPPEENRVEVNLSILPEVSPAAAEDLHIWVKTTSRAERNLQEVTLEARYFIEATEFEIILQTMMFTP